MQNGIKKFGGIWLPAHETHLVDWMRKMGQVRDGVLTYQQDKRDLALSYVKNWRTAVDVGGHCGLWSMWLAKRFHNLHAFEPVALHRQCFALNVVGPVTLHCCALGDRDGSISMHTSEGSSGDSWIDGAGDIPLRRLDDLELQDVDFMKLDCEGGELPALRGAEETLKRCRPVVIVEQKPGNAQKYGLPETGAVDYLQSLGATLRTKKSGDYILTFD